MIRYARALVLMAVAASALGAQQPSGGVPLAGAATLDRVVAVVGQHPILYTEVVELVNQRQTQQGFEMPRDTAGFVRTMLNELIDQQVLIEAAHQYKIEIPDADVQADVDQFVKGVKASFETEPKFREALKANGFGTETEFRKFRTELQRKDLLARRALDSLRAHGRLAAPVSVTEEEVTAAFEKNRERLPKRPSSIAFRQIVIPPRPSAAAKRAALAKAESLLVEIRAGADFEKVARRESMDPASKELGGDLGWNRRGVMVPEFDRVMFALPPGIVSNPVETSLGVHIIRVDRVQPAEVKARHILIMWHVDSADVTRAHLVADTVSRLWKSGTPFDTLVARYHDSEELKTVPDAYEVDSLPAEYRKAVEGVKAGELTAPFEIPNPRTGFAKVGVLQVTQRIEGGDYTMGDMRDRIRKQLQQEKQSRRMLDQLRKEQFVSIRL